MNQTARHTKTPWRVGRAHGIKGVYNIMVDEMSDEEDIANAKFLAHAVNSHDALVDLLKQAIPFIGHLDNKCDCDRCLLGKLIESALKLESEA